MDTFTTLIFIPEGTLLNEKLAERTALRKTVKHYTGNFGPAERIKYTDLTAQFKLLSQNQRINLILENFLPSELPEAKLYFNDQLSKQHQVIKGSPEFLQTIKGKINLFLLGKEKKTQLLPRLKAGELDSYFESIYFPEDFKEKLPDKAILRTIISKTNVDPDQVLVVGANLSDEIQAAENSNLKSLWLAPKKEKIPITPHPTLHLAKLSDLLFYLNIE